MNQVDTKTSMRVPKVFVICNQPDTAPVWGFILRQEGLAVVLEKSLENTVDHWSAETPDLTVVDVDVADQMFGDVCKQIRSISVAPILLLLPAYNEKQVLNAYHCGVDDVIIKPISPAVFLAKIKAWSKRAWTLPVEGLGPVKAGRYRLDALKRCLIDPEEKEIKITNLEFHFLHLLMNKPGEILGTEELIQSIWGNYGGGDHILLKNVVYRLRKKIETNPGKPVHLITWPGGYSFQ